ncbi:Mdm33 family-domain-containing protein [Absidia repens]|uniref:Sensitive to high expression protein 9, mitochondrial n=1 Tax=Absidia repens TaxID=90262 RepID=A0A1X2IEN3_9FUNG|nr:Mdm33 family-domain-containing protein [Absidia repens]
MTFRRPIVMLGRRPPFGWKQTQIQMLRPTTATTITSYSYSTNANTNDPKSTTKNDGIDSKDDIGKNSFETNNNSNSNVSWDKSASYQNALTTVQTLSRSHMQKLHRDIQPLIHKVQNATDTLKRLGNDVTDSKDALRRASMALNELTGYNQIELVKKKVTDQATTFELTRDQVQIAKKRYELAIATRSNTQRGINELLQRKHLWTGEDVTQFTELYRLEHEHAKEEDMAKEHYQQKEKQMDREYMALARSIMERYHDEQLWSDKIRSVSTYGTWALMVLNLMLFVAVQTVFEPRKRKRLTDRFEELLVDKVAEQEEKFNDVADTMAHTDQVLMEQQQILVDLMTQLKDESSFSTATSTSSSADMDHSHVEEQQQIATGIPPTIISDNNNNEQFLEEGAEPISILETSDDNTYDQDRHTLIVDDNNNNNTKDNNDIEPISSLDSSSIVLSQRSLVLYSLESALAGGLITALAVFLWK